MTNLSNSTPLPSSEEAPALHEDLVALEALAAKFERDPQVWLGFNAPDRSALLRRIARQLQTALSERDEARAKLKRHGFTSDDVRQP